MNPFNLIGQYFWLIALVIGGFNYLATTRKIESSSTDDPRTTPEARSLRLWFAIVSEVPWVVMGWGELAGGVPNVWSYFRPQDGNPYVLAWYGVVFCITLGFVYWVFVCGGAEKSVELQLFSLKSTRGNITLTPGRVKLFTALGPVWFALWVLLVVSMNAPIPK
jgi:hypothetical protein